MHIASAWRQWQLCLMHVNDSLHVSSCMIALFSCTHSAKAGDRVTFGLSALRHGLPTHLLPASDLGVA